MSKTSPTSVLRDGFISSLGYGMTVGVVHLAVGIGLIISLGQPPLTGLAIQSIFIEVGLALAVGMVLSPLVALPRGRVIHPVAMALAWIAMELYVAVDPAKVQMWLAPSLVALLIYFGMRRFGSGKPALAWALGPVLSAILISLPAVREIAQGGNSLEPNPDRGDAPEGAPDVLFIVMDTTRAQNVSAYGYERETTPSFDAFAKEGLFFKDANAPATWSLPAHAALFTGAFPSVNNAHGETRYLDDKLETLAETMSKAGWETRCFSANPHISESFGLTRGFEWSDRAWATGASARGFSFILRFAENLGIEAEDKGGATVVGNIQDWMKDRKDSDPPAFVFVNFLEAHIPFHQLPEDYLYKFGKHDISVLREASQMAFGVQFGRQLTDEEYELIHQPIVDMYDAGVNYTDALVGRTIDIWREAGKLDNTLVVVLADHGELVGEHGAFGHLMPVYEQDLRVPFAIRYPPKIKAGSVIEEPISTLGTYATLLDLLDLESLKPASVQMDTLMPGLEGKPVGQPVIAERFEEEMLAARFEPGTANGDGPLLMPHGRYRTFREKTGRYKLAKHSDGGIWLYDLKRDPGEESDVAARKYDKRDELMKELALFESLLKLPPLGAEVEKVEGPADDEAAMEALRALGYVE
jgi:arylsulfatase A-like enzyme